MFSGYSFKNYVHASKEKVLDFFDKDIWKASNGLNDTYVKFARESGKRDIHIDFYAERKDNAFVILGKDYTTLPGALYPEDNQEPIWTTQIRFDVEGKDDNTSLVTGYFEENPIYKDIALFVARKFYAIVINLGARFSADWRNGFNETYREIESQLEKERGGHEGLMECVIGESVMNVWGFIPTESETANTEQADAGKSETQESKNDNPEIVERRNKVRKLKQHGHDDKYVANQLGVTPKTVQRDKGALGILKHRKKGH